MCGDPKHGAIDCANKRALVPEHLSEPAQSALQAMRAKTDKDVKRVAKQARAGSEQPVVRRTASKRGRGSAREGDNLEAEEERVSMNRQQPDKRRRVEKEDPSRNPCDDRSRHVAAARELPPWRQVAERAFPVSTQRSSERSEPSSCAAAANGVGGRSQGRSGGADEHSTEHDHRRWKSQGNSRQTVAPPTLVWHASKHQDGGCLWLSGLPVEEMRTFFEANNITLVISAMGRRIQECHVGTKPSRWGWVPDNVFVVKVDVGDPDGRNVQAKEAYQLLGMTLGAGENALVHCMAGVRHGALLTAAYLAALENITVEEAVQHIGRVRAINFEEMLRAGPNQGEAQLAVFLHGVGRSLRKVRLPPPVRVHEWWSCDRGQLVHAMCHGSPICLWRRGAHAALFRGRASKMDTLMEALALPDRKVCKDCRSRLPASMQRILQQAG